MKKILGDYADLPTAITGIGNVPTTVEINVPIAVHPVGAQVVFTIPNTWDIHYIDGGQLVPDAGVTVWHEAVPIANPNVQIFAGAGRVRLRKTLVSYPGWFGVKGDGVVDDTVACQRWIDDSPNYSELVMPTNCKIRLTNTLKIYKKQGLKIRGACQACDYGTWVPSATEQVPVILYDGPQDGIAVDMDGVVYCHLQDFCIHGNGKALVGLNIDRSGTYGSTSHITARSLSLANPTNTNPESAALRIAYVSAANVEHLRFEDLNISWYDGYGVRCGGGGGSANSLTNVIEHGQFSVRNGRAIDPGTAYWKVVDCLFNHNNTDFYFSKTPTFVLIEYCRSEGPVYFIETGPQGGQKSLVIRNNVVTAAATPAGDATIRLQPGGRSVLCQNNEWNNNAVCGPDLVYAIKVKPGFSGFLNSHGNTWPGLVTLNGSLQSFNQGYCCLGDNYHNAQNNGVGPMPGSVLVERAGDETNPPVQKKHGIILAKKTSIYGTDAAGNLVELIGSP